MEVVFFILPLAIFPVIYVILCMVYGRRSFAFLKKKKDMKIKSEYSLFYRYALATILLFLSLILLKEEIINGDLNDKDLIMLLLLITTVFALSRQKRRAK